MKIFSTLATILDIFRPKTLVYCTISARFRASSRLLARRTPKPQGTHFHASICSYFAAKSFRIGYFEVWFLGERSLNQKRWDFEFRA